MLGTFALGSGEQARRRGKAKGGELEREPGDCPARGRSAGDLDRGSSAGDGEETGGMGSLCVVQIRSGEPGRGREAGDVQSLGPAVFAVSSAPRLLR